MFGGICVQLLCYYSHFYIVFFTCATTLDGPKRCDIILLRNISIFFVYNSNNPTYFIFIPHTSVDLINIPISNFLESFVPTFVFAVNARRKSCSIFVACHVS